MTAEVQPIKPGRLLSLDAFRGITIAAMLLVNNTGDWGHMFPPLGHADWNGCTATDLIFPFFLFIMGVAMTFSFSRRLQEPGGSAHLVPQIIRRALLLIGLGLMLNLVSFLATRGLDWAREDFRFAGVLQRIGLCYLFAALIALWFRVRGQVIWTAGLLLVYYILLKYVAPPGVEHPTLDMQGNLASWIDTKIMGAHCYKHVKGTDFYHDPEGLLSTLPAIATTLTGLLTGHWLREKTRDGNEKVAGMATAGWILFVVGELWKYDFPYNKNLWTSSYVLHTSALALWTLAAFYWIIDVKKITAWSKPMVVYGTNAITAYFGVGLMSSATIWIKWHDAEGQVVMLKTWLYQKLFERPIAELAPYIFPESYSEYISSAAYPLIMYVALWCGLMWILYRKRIFIKI